MKKLNKKGFTLIELLAVIVILAILVAVAIPAVTRYLNQARRGAFSSDAATMIDVARNNFLLGTDPTKTGNNVIYTGAEINAFLERKLEKSPYGANYNTTSSFVRIVTSLPSGETDPTKAVTKYYVCLTDGTQGIYEIEKNIKDTNVTTEQTTCSSSGTLPAE